MGDEVKVDAPVPRPSFYQEVGELGPLFTALAAAQGEFPEIIKNEKADAGKFGYNYADLATVLRAIRPVLSRNGLALLNPLGGGTAAGFSVRTILAHSSGAYLSSTVIIPYQDDPQEFGSRVSYVRRYSDLAMVGVFPAEEDDDGLKAHKKAQQPTQAPRQEAPRKTPPPLPVQAANGAPKSEPPPKPMTDTAPMREPPQVEDTPAKPETKLELRTYMTALGFKPPDVLRKVATVFGHGIKPEHVTTEKMAQDLLASLMRDVERIPGLVTKIPDIREQQAKLGAK